MVECSEPSNSRTAPRPSRVLALPIRCCAAGQAIWPTGSLRPGASSTILPAELNFTCGIQERNDPPVCFLSVRNAWLDWSITDIDLPQEDPSFVMTEFARDLTCVAGARTDSRSDGAKSLWNRGLKLRNTAGILLLLSCKCSERAAQKLSSPVRGSHWSRHLPGG